MAPNVIPHAARTGDAAAGAAAETAARTGEDAAARMAEETGDLKAVMAAALRVGAARAAVPAAAAALRAMTGVQSGRRCCTGCCSRR